jgi:ribonuclease D
MDCAFLFTKVHQQVVNAYCTKIASKISRTYSSSHSLSSIVGELFNVKIDKQMQTSFWGDEDISEERREYLISDCRYLLDLKHKLEEIMDKKGSLTTGISYRELNQNCQAFIPTLVHLWVNGWDFGKEDQDSVFGR